jgi:hypothetical protein
MSGFAEAMTSINRRRRELSKILEYQEDEGTKRYECDCYIIHNNAEFFI